MRVLFILAMALALGASAQARRNREVPTGLRTVHFNQAPPDFSFPDGARPQRLSALVGRPVVINFWTTWCHACLDEMPAFSKLQETYGDRVAFITLSNEMEGTARTFVADHHLGVPLLEDPRSLIFTAYSIETYPVTVVVSASGKVSYVSVGGLDWPELQAAVERALAAPAGH